jgi:L-fuculose-phosphate aldolase
MGKTLNLQTAVRARAGASREAFVDAGLILATQGHTAGLAGQLTVRDGETLLTLPLGTGFDEVTEDDVIRVDLELNTLEGRGSPNPAVRFHSWIYRRHPHVHAIVHTHPPALSALSMLGIPMPVAHMDAAMFHDDCGFLDRWPGVPTGDEEGQLISGALQGMRTALLVNHGAVCTGATIQEAIYLMVFAERNARLCLDAMSAGSLQRVEPAAAREAHDFLLQPAIVDTTFAYWARQARRAVPQ